MGRSDRASVQTDREPISPLVERLGVAMLLLTFGSGDLLRERCPHLLDRRRQHCAILSKQRGSHLYLVVLSNHRKRDALQSRILDIF